MNGAAQSSDVGSCLALLGWSDWHEQRLLHQDASARPGRVMCQVGATYWVDNGAQRVQASLAGRVKHAAASEQELPVVGDWVLIEMDNTSSQASARITKILERKSVLARRRPGNRGNAQLIGANVDLGFVVWGLDRPPNVRLFRRVVVLAHAANIEPVIVLTKADLCADAEGAAEEVRSNLALPVVVMSSTSGSGIDALSRTIGLGKTAALIGPSGAGKSSIVNALIGTGTIRTGEVRRGDYKGQHTTTHRELFQLPSGGLLLDAPGMREFGLLGDVAAVELAFPDVSELVKHCASSVCGHTSEPGCAIVPALAEGEITAERLSEYHSLLAEATAESSPHAHRGATSKHAKKSYRR